IAAEQAAIRCSEVVLPAVHDAGSIACADAPVTDKDSAAIKIAKGAALIGMLATVFPIPKPRGSHPLVVLFDDPRDSAAPRRAARLSISRCLEWLGSSRATPAGQGKGLTTGRGSWPAIKDRDDVQPYRPDQAVVRRVSRSRSRRPDPHAQPDTTTPARGLPGRPPGDRRGSLRGLRPRQRP